MFAGSRLQRYYGAPSGETDNAVGEKTIRRKSNIMGDKSPKSLNKHTTQKQTKATSVVQKKQQAVAAKQVAAKKR